MCLRTLGDLKKTLTESSVSKKIKQIVNQPIGAQAPAKIMET